MLCSTTQDAMDGRSTYNISCRGPGMVMRHTATSFCGDGADKHCTCAIPIMNCVADPYIHRLAQIRLRPFDRECGRESQTNSKAAV